MARLHILIPAHNEEGSIGQTLESLKASTADIYRVVVVADNCTDATVKIAMGHRVEILPTYGNEHMKAGALNQGLEYLLGESVVRYDPGYRVTPVEAEDRILIMDADSRLDPGFIDAACAELDADPRAGAVCASFAGEPDRNSPIHIVQRNEYARFARKVARKNAFAEVLSGVATVFPVATLREVQEARKNGLLPPAPGFYEVTAATEDIEMTFALRKLGYRPRAPKACLAFTDTMSDWKALARQRIRWQRGMLDALSLYRLNRQTFPYALRLLFMYLGSLVPALYLGIVLWSVTSGGSIGVQLIWLALIPFFALERVVTVNRLGWRERLMAVLLLPEWLYDNWRAVVYWIAFIRWLKRTEREWIPT